MTNVVKKHSISYELARKMVDEALAKAKEIGVSENVTILDGGDRGAIHAAKGLEIAALIGVAVG